MFLSMNTIPDLEKLYASLGERDYEAVMSHFEKRPPNFESGSLFR